MLTLLNATFVVDGQFCFCYTDDRKAVNVYGELGTT